MAERKSIQLMLVDDHEMVRRGLAIFFQTLDDFEVIAEATDGESAVALASELHPDVVLMDINMPVMNGITTTRLIREKCPNTKVVVLTSSDDVTSLREVIRAGAFDYLLKSSSTHKLAETLRMACM